jgi:hypothetical protein
MFRKVQMKMLVKSCSNYWPQIRYNYYLCPDIVKDPWSRQEDLAILNAHQTVGNKWKEM